MVVNVILSATKAKTRTQLLQTVRAFVLLVVPAILAMVMVPAQVPESVNAMLVTLHRGQVNNAVWGVQIVQKTMVFVSPSVVNCSVSVILDFLVNPVNKHVNPSIIFHVLDMVLVK